MKLSRFSLAIAAAFAFMFASGAQALTNRIIIDDFQTAQADVTADDVLLVGNPSPQSGFASGAPTTSVIGGERDITVSFTDGAANNGDVITDGVSGGGPYLTTRTVGDGSVFQSQIVWDGGDAAAAIDNATGLGGIDLTDGGNADRFALVLGAVSNSFTITGNFYDAAGVIAGTGFSQVVNTPDAGTTLEFLFANFGGAMAYTNVTAIELLIAGPNANSNLEIVSFAAAVPLPPAVWAGMVLLGGVGALKRRRNKQLAEA